MRSFENMSWFTNLFLKACGNFYCLFLMCVHVCALRSVFVHVCRLMSSVDNFWLLHQQQSCLSFFMSPEVVLFLVKSQLHSRQACWVTSNHSTSVWCVGRCLVTGSPSESSSMEWLPALCQWWRYKPPFVLACVKNDNNDNKKTQVSHACVFGSTEGRLCSVWWCVPEKKHDPDIPCCSFPSYYFTPATSQINGLSVLITFELK